MSGLVRRLCISVVASGVAVGLAFGSASSERSVEVSTSALSVGTPTTFDVTIKNDGDAPAQVTRLELDSEWARSLEITSSQPEISHTTTSEFGGSVLHHLDLTVPAKGTASVRIEAIPRLGGTRSGSFKACFSDDTCTSASVHEAIAGPDAEPLVLTVEAPAEVKVGDAFELVLVMQNNGTLEDILIDASLNEELLNRVQIDEVAPQAASVEDSQLFGRTWDYQRPVAPGSELRVVWQMTATNSGVVKDYVNVCVESWLLCGQPDYTVRINP